MTHQVLATRTRRSDPGEVWRGDTLQEAREHARSWLNANGKPGEAVVKIWDEDSGMLHLTMQLDAHGLIHEDAGADADRLRVVWDYLREIAGEVVPARYDFDRKEYRFAIEGGYTVAMTREFLRETRDIPATLRSRLTVENIHNTGTEHTLVLTSHGSEVRPNQT